MTYVIAQPCVDVLDRSCVEECPVDCIYEGKRMLYIHPDEWAEYYDVNVSFFDKLGSPGGAAKTGPTGYDHPFVAALPPQNQD